MTIVDFSRVKDYQLSAYLQSVEAAIGRQAIHASVADLAELPPDELAERLREAKDELQSRTLAPEPPQEPPTELRKWRMAEGYPRRSTTARGTWDLRITDGEHTLEFLSLSDGGPQSPLEWAVEQAEAMDETSFRIATGQLKPEPHVWPAEVQEQIDAEARGISELAAERVNDGN